MKCPHIEFEVNLTWFGILIAVNLYTARLSRQVVLSAYFLEGVAPDRYLKNVDLDMVKLIVIQLFGLILIFNFPQIVLW